MSSKWSSSLRGALAWRLGVWYAALFLIGAGALTVFAYLLLARALEARDRQVLESLLSRYATQYQRAGLSGLSRLIQRDAGEGRTERMLIRVTNGATDVIYLAEPADWNRSDAQLLDQSARGNAGWVRIPKSRDAVLAELRQRGIIVTTVGPYTNFRDPEGRVIKLSEEKTIVS